MAELSIQQVSKVFDRDVRAVCDVSLDIADGEFLVLVGPSGCGKSTLLRMIAGLEQITAGTIRIGGRVVNQVAPRDRDVAMVFQNYALYPHMTVFDNLAFGLKLRKCPKREIGQRIEQVADLLELTALLRRKPKALSGGQRQRVALGRAIVRNPAVFLFDEPLSNLDAKLRTQMRVEIARLHKRLGTTMIYVTHDQVEAMTLGQRIVLLKDGIVQQVDDPLSLYDRPVNQFVAGFIGTPPMNFIPGRLCEGQGGLSFESADGQNLALSGRHAADLISHANQAVVMGVRPEDIGSPAAEQQHAPPRLRAIVELVEPMGFEQYVHLRLGQQGTSAQVGDSLQQSMPHSAAACVIRVDAHQRFVPGQQISPAILMERSHFFDPQSGRTLLHNAK